MYNLIKTARVIVDPNSFSRIHADWSASPFTDADFVPEVGARVLAVQDDIDGSAYIANAIVKLIDLERELLYLEVDWSTFVDEGFATSNHLQNHPQIEYSFRGAGRGLAGGPNASTYRSRIPALTR